jgi:hypothetical protein
MRNIDMLEINKNEETAKIVKMPAKTRRKVKAFLNEGALQLSF